jgi:hypothetical protein
MADGLVEVVEVVVAHLIFISVGLLLHLYSWPSGGMSWAPMGG